MKYIAILDYYHLDHSFFMKSFAEGMAQQQGCSGIILHGDSPYTERLMQTGMMREDAAIRSTKDLNHRIIALLADNGVSGIGINGYQKKIIQFDGSNLIIDRKWLDARPAGTHVVLSNLVWDTAREEIVPISPGTLAAGLRKELEREMILIFSSGDENGIITESSDSKITNGNKSSTKEADNIPEDIHPIPDNSYLCTSISFGKLPEKSDLEIIF